MRDAEALAKDRRRYHLHAATLIVGVLGIIGTLVLWDAVEPPIASFIGADYAPFVNATAPYAVLILGLLFCAGFVASALLF